MSLYFKPTIATTFEHIKPVVPVVKIKPKVIEPAIIKLVLDTDGRNQSAWSLHDLNILAHLRALGVTFVECGKHLNRSTNSCGSAVHTHNLYDAIKDKRKEIINGALNG